MPTATIRITHVTTGLEVGGAEIMLYRLLANSDSRYFRHSVISLTAGGTLRPQIESVGVPVFDLGMQRGFPTPGSALRLLRLLGRLAPDILQGWMYHGNLAAWFGSITTRQQPPVIWGIHHSIYDLEREKRLTAAAIKLGARVSGACYRLIYVSHVSREQHERIGYRSDRGCIIPNGFETERFQPSPTSRAEVRDEFGIATDAPLIGLVCRYHPMKDHANFLRAAAQLLPSHPNARFLLIGTDVTPENPDLQALVTQLGLGDRALFLGQRDDMPRLMAALDIGGLSSATGEAFPLVVGEAMACGVPCTVTDVGDAGVMVADTGRVVPPKNPNALAAAWSELIELGADGRALLGARARARVQEHFALPAVTAQYEQIYTQAMASSTCIRDK
ncbi:glycosyltransferase [Rubidibacter lacunae KORDI 51-2]|uniref:Glycosyltransferase n=1 Tax=Rubidibacter lacunae KORDI 51-2 TaxID=582515 RepID=U5DMC5_9CHRO|nr:glycosyltransferase [Rubidibacter lacunae]ERN41744.1 glycosyltransferase [Rubidibacter lacunae KORDI 51-2]